MEKKENIKTQCPTRWQLTEFVAGETSSDRSIIAEHLVRCQRCSEEVKQLEEARERFLASHPPQAVLSSLEASRPAAPTFWRWAAAAACLVVVMVAAFFLTTSNPVERVKGGWSVQVYLLRQGKISRAESGQEFFPGDRIQFTYTVPREGWLFLVSVDSQGRVTSFNPDGAEVSVRIEAGSEKVVEGSIELDDTSGQERVFAIFSDRPLLLGELRGIIASDLQRSGGGVMNLDRLSLEYPQASFLMMKRTTVAK